MRLWKMLFLVSCLLSHWHAARAAPIVYEISIEITTYSQLPTLSENPEFWEHWNPTLQIGDTAQFRVAIDTERQGADPLGYYFNDFYAELIGVNFDGVWLETSILGGGRLEPSYPGWCTHSIWSCGGIHVGYWTFFSDAPTIEAWVDPSYRHMFCNVLGRPATYVYYCDFTGTGRMTEIHRVPEPGTLGLLGLGVMGISLARRRALAH